MGLTQKGTLKLLYTETGKKKKIPNLITFRMRGNKFTQPKKSQATRDIRLSFQQDARLVDGVVKAGAYCRWCL